MDRYDASAVRYEYGARRGGYPWVSDLARCYVPGDPWSVAPGEPPVAPPVTPPPTPPIIEVVITLPIVPPIIIRL